MLTAATFANTLPNAFHLDDIYRLVENPAVRTVSPWRRHFVDVHTMATLPAITNYRPLLPLTLSLNYAIGGLAPVGYHVVNIALQAVAAVLVYLLFNELLVQGSTVRRSLQPWVALTAAAIFAVHPVSGIPVNYVTARDLLLMQVFMIGSLLIHVRMRGSGSDTPGGWVAILALYVLALLSKTSVVVLPGIVMAYEVAVRRENPFSPGPWLRATPFLVLAIAFFAYVSLVLNHSDFDVVRSNEYTSVSYGATQLKLHLLRYMRVAPDGLGRSTVRALHFVRCVARPPRFAGGHLLRPRLLGAAGSGGVPVPSVGSRDRLSPLCLEPFPLSIHRRGRCGSTASSTGEAPSPI